MSELDEYEEDPKESQLENMAVPYKEALLAMLKEVSRGK